MFTVSEKDVSDVESNSSSSGFKRFSLQSIIIKLKLCSVDNAGLNVSDVFNKNFNKMKLFNCFRTVIMKPTC